MSAPVIDAPGGTSDYARRRWLRAVDDHVAGALFCQADGSAVSLDKVALGAIFVMVAMAASLLRTAGAGALHTITFEDGTNYLTDALNGPTLSAIFKTLNGYYVIPARIMAWFATLFPLHYAAAVLTLEAAFTGGLLALVVYVASGAQLRTPLLRLLVSVPVVVVPVAQGPSFSTDNNVATLQFLALYALFWVLIWVPATRTGRAVALIVTIGAVLSTLLAVLFLPLAIVRLVARRGQQSILLAGIIAAGAILNVIALASGAAARPPELQSRYDVVWAIRQYFVALPRLLLGQTWSYAHGLSEMSSGQRLQSLYASTLSVAPAGLMVATFAVIIAVVAVAALRMTSPAWLLAAVAGTYSVGEYLACVMSTGAQVSRYQVDAALLLIAGLAALVRPTAAGLRARHRAAPTRVRVMRHPAAIRYLPALAIAGLLAVVCVTNFRDPDIRAFAPTWHHAVASAGRRCAADPDASQVTVLIAQPVWHVAVPCRLVRR